MYRLSRTLLTLLPLLLAFTLGCVWGETPQAAAPATLPDTAEPPAPIPAPGSLRVEVQLLATSAQPGAEVPAKFRVTNISKTPQSFRVVNCAWADHWSMDTNHLHLWGQICGKNFAYTETLPPGESYERADDVYVMHDAPFGTLTMRFGFQPIGLSRPISSDPVTLHVVRGPLAKANLWGTWSALTFPGGWAIWRIVRRRPQPIIHRLSWSARMARGFVATLFLASLLLLSASHWRELSANLWANYDVASGGTLWMFFPSDRAGFQWGTYSATEGFVYLERAYSAASFHFIGFASHKDRAWQIMIPLWFPCVFTGLMTWLTWRLTSPRHKGFPVQPAPASEIFTPPPAPPASAPASIPASESSPVSSGAH